MNGKLGAFFGLLLRGDVVELSKSRLTTRRGSKAADWVNERSMALILAALTAANRRVMWLALCTGLRISDVLHIKTAQLWGKNGQKGDDLSHGIRISCKEQKTGQTRRVWVPAELRRDLLSHAGQVWLFPGRFRQDKPRTRQAVAKDIQRARALLRLPAKVTVSAHSARKMYAVRHGYGSLHHKSLAVEQMYDTSDLMTRKKLRGKRSDLTD